MIGLGVRLRGQARYKLALLRINPKQNPEPVRRAFLDAEKILAAGIRGHMSGPRPRKLDRVTGELAASVAGDRSDLPDAIRVGVPAAKFWFAFHESGAGRRFRKRPAVKPALDESLDEVADRLLLHWRRASDLPA